MELVHRAERAGCESFWVADSSLVYRDCYAYLTLAALESKRMRIGVNVTHPYTRHPAINANAIATVNEISGGRAILGIGAGDRPVLELGFRMAPVDVVRNMVTICRQLFAGQTLNVDSGPFLLKGASLRYQFDSPIPIHIAASGPRMLELAGEVGDGVAVLCGMDPRCIDFALEHVARGATRSGRTLRDLDISLEAFGAIWPDRRQALADGALVAAWFAKTSPVYCDIMGLDKDLVERIRQSYAGSHAYEAAEAAALIPSAVVEGLALVGTPQEAADKLRGLTKKQVKRVTFSSWSPDHEHGLRVFLDEVAPLLVGGRKPREHATQEIKKN